MLQSVFIACCALILQCSAFLLNSRLRYTSLPFHYRISRGWRQDIPKTTSLFLRRQHSLTRRKTIVSNVAGNLDASPLRSYSEKGDWKNVEDFIREMNNRDLPPTSDIFHYLIESYLHADSDKIIEADEVLTEMFRSGFTPSPELCCKVIEALGRIGKPQRAEVILNRFTFLYNSLQCAPLYRSVIRAWHLSANTQAHQQSGESFMYSKDTATSIKDLFDRLRYLGLPPEEGELLYYFASIASLYPFASPVPKNDNSNVVPNHPLITAYLQYKSSIQSSDIRTRLYTVIFRILVSHCTQMGDSFETGIGVDVSRTMDRNNILAVFNFFREEISLSPDVVSESLILLLLSINQLRWTSSGYTRLVLMVLNDLQMHRNSTQDVINVESEFDSDVKWASAVSKYGSMSNMSLEVLEATVSMLSRDRDIDPSYCVYLLTLICLRQQPQLPINIYSFSSSSIKQVFIATANMLARRPSSVPHLNIDEQEQLLYWLVELVNEHTTDDEVKSSTTFWNIVLTAFQRLYRDSKSDVEHMQVAITLVEDSMQQGQATPDALTFSLILAHYLKTAQHDKVLLLSKAIDDRGLNPSLATCYFLLVSQVQSLQQFHDLQTETQDNESPESFRVRRQVLQRAILASFSRLVRTYRYKYNKMKIREQGYTNGVINSSNAVPYFENLSVRFPQRPRQEDFLSVLRAYRLLVTKPGLISLPRDFFDEMLLWVSELPMLPLSQANEELVSSQNSHLPSTENNDTEIEDNEESSYHDYANMLNRNVRSKSVESDMSISVNQPDADYVIGSMVTETSNSVASETATAISTRNTSPFSYHRLKTQADLGFEVLQDMRKIRLEADLTQYVFLLEALHHSVLAKPYNVPGRASEVFNYLITEKLLLASGQDSEHLALERRAIELVLLIWHDSHRPDSARCMEKIIQQLIALSEQPRQVLSARCFELLLSAWLSSRTPLSNQRAESVLAVMRDLQFTPSPRVYAMLARNIVRQQDTSALSKIVQLLKDNILQGSVAHESFIAALAEALLLFLEQSLDSSSSCLSHYDAYEALQTLFAITLQSHSNCDNISGYFEVIAQYDKKSLSNLSVNDLLGTVVAKMPLQSIQLSARFYRKLIRYLSSQQSVNKNDMSDDSDEITGSAVWKYPSLNETVAEFIYNATTFPLFQEKSSVFLSIDKVTQLWPAKTLQLYAIAEDIKRLVDTDRAERNSNYNNNNYNSDNKDEDDLNFSESSTVAQESIAEAQLLLFQMHNMFRANLLAEPKESRRIGTSRKTEAAMQVLIDTTVSGIWKPSTALKQLQYLVSSGVEYNNKINVVAFESILHYLTGMRTRFPIARYATEFLRYVDLQTAASDEEVEEQGEHDSSMLSVLRRVAQIYGIYAREVAEKLPHDSFAIVQEIMRLGVQPDTLLLNRILDAAARRKQLSLAERVFFLMFELGFVPERRACRSLLTSLASSDRISADERTYDAFMKMLVAGAPLDGNTLSSLLIALAKSTSPLAIERADLAFDRARRVGIVTKTSLYNALLNVHAKSPSIEAPIRSMKVFQDMRSNGIEPDRCTYNILLSAWASSNRPDAEANVEELVKEADALNIAPDVVSYTIRLSMLRRSKRDNAHELALALLEDMRRNNVEPDEVAWTSFLDVLSKSRVQNREDLVRQLYKEMRESGSKPNAVTYTVLLSMWTQSSDPRASSEIMMLFRDMVASGISYEQATYNSLLLALSKSGDRTAPFKALDIFYSMISAGMTPDSINLNHLLTLWGNSKVPHHELVCSILFACMRFGDLSAVQQIMTLAGDQGEASPDWTSERLQDLLDTQLEITSNNKVYRQHTHVNTVDAIADKYNERNVTTSITPSKDTTNGKVTTGLSSASLEGGEDSSSEGAMYYESLAVALRATSDLQREQGIRNLSTRLRPTAQTYTLMLSVWTRSNRQDAILQLRQLYAQFCKDEIRMDGIGFSALLTALGRIYGVNRQSAALDEAERLLLVLVNYGVPPAATAWAAFFRAARDDGDRTMRLFRLMVASGVDIDEETCRLVAMNIARLQQGGIILTIQVPKTATTDIDINAHSSSNNNDDNKNVEERKVLVPAAMLIEEVFREMMRRQLSGGTMLANSRIIAWSRLRQQLFLHRQLMQQQQQLQSSSLPMQQMRQNRQRQQQSSESLSVMRTSEDQLQLQALPLHTEGWPGLTEHDVSLRMLSLLREFLGQDAHRPFVLRGSVNTQQLRSQSDRRDSKIRITATSPVSTKKTTPIIDLDTDFIDEFDLASDEDEELRFDGFDPPVLHSGLLTSQEDEDDLPSVASSTASSPARDNHANNYQQQQNNYNYNHQYSVQRADHITMRSATRYFATALRSPSSLRTSSVIVLVEATVLVEALLEQTLHAVDGSKAARDFFMDSDQCNDLIEMYVLIAQRIHIQLTNNSRQINNTSLSNFAKDTAERNSDGNHYDLDDRKLVGLRRTLLARVLVLSSLMLDKDNTADTAVVARGNTIDGTAVDDAVKSLQSALSNLQLPTADAVLLTIESSELQQSDVAQDWLVARWLKLKTINRSLEFGTADFRTLRFFLTALNLLLDKDLQQDESTVYRITSIQYVLDHTSYSLSGTLQALCQLALGWQLNVFTPPSSDAAKSLNSTKSPSEAVTRVWRRGVGTKVMVEPTFITTTPVVPPAVAGSRTGTGSVTTLTLDRSQRTSLTDLFSQLLRYSQQYSAVLTSRQQLDREELKKSSATDLLSLQILAQETLKNLGG